MEITQQLLNDVLELAKQAGEHSKVFYAKNLTVQTKSDNTPVTEADLFISQFLTQKLTSITPDIPVLSEENCHIDFNERKQWQAYWLIDPIDGTQQFISHTDQFSVMICLVQNNQPMLGVIHAPMLNRTYYAWREHGAFLIENGITKKLPKIQPHNRTQIKIAIGSSNPEKIRQSIKSPYQPEFIVYGSSSLKSGLVAEGIVDCYVRFGNTGEWDTAVADILLHEVDCKIFDLSFQPLTYNQRETLINPYFVMGNCKLDWQKIFQFNT
ncbi:3'(2'),5'-bisphosphate nucleotidase CysQ [Pasteurella bettyae]|uniref:3'(2'),5'-bisphosphate nucleotidase CysQ n=1 Tax=Pasteurella bettyae CCUG 2042 TaxID=1095749 RepID=I3DBK1_9PAST|nr:3'(2'),5'-bisphosphate nucleotidase CysQ [Pasteurella bettyae]EIJ69094.1 3'(2'),5'-bisphosphate nucleotidase [Pasteurella bettyae CCUG 2042]SUB22946.1 3'(2'),5'-bisphosphate nucleotidase [Pasteurella bettyae]